MTSKGCRAPSKSLAVGSGLLAALLTGPDTAVAQADLNVESRIKSQTPRFPDRVPLVSVPKLERKVVRRLKPRTELDALIAQLPAFRSLGIAMKDLPSGERARLVGLLGERAYTTTVVETMVVPPRRYAAELSLAIDPGFDSNVARSDRVPRGDGSTGIGPAARLAIPIGDRYDQFVLGAAATAVQYAELARRDFDLVNASVALQSIEPHTDPRYGTPGTTWREVFEFATRGALSFEPTFSRNSIYFVTPSVAMHWLNLPVSPDICAGRSGARTYCHFADFSVRFGHAFSDVTQAQNGSAALAGKLGWRIPAHDLTLAVGGGITGKVYSQSSVARRDLALSIGPRIEHAPTPSVYVSLSADYTDSG